MTAQPASFIAHEQVDYIGEQYRQKSIEARYRALVAAGAVRHDAAQITLVTRLDTLSERLCQRESAPAVGWFPRLFRRKSAIATPPRGLYIHGAVGRGKTMLMDLFYDSLAVSRKRRVHFNDFMNEVQNRLAEQRQKVRDGTVKDADPIPPIAADLARSATILCFDEFSVTDIADAMILGRLFTALFAHGVVLVATSNVAPDDLYQNGLNRALFLPFIAILKNHVDLFNLDAPTDYRLEKTGKCDVYFTPLGVEASQKMNDAWASVTLGAPETSDCLKVRGHALVIPRAAQEAVRFDFADLCSKPLAAYDYSALSQKYRIFFVDNVPFFDNDRRNEAKRFILLVDTLYEAKARLFISAAAVPNKLYRAQRTTTESFEFTRTASRLFEMQSAGYLAE